MTAQVHSQYIAANETTMQPATDLYFWRCLECHDASHKVWLNENTAIKAAVKHNIAWH